MKAIFDERQLLHRPETYFRRGAAMVHPEQAERAILIRNMLLRNDFVIEAPDDRGEAAIVAVHGQDYVDFWKTAHQRWKEVAPEGALAIPAYHPGQRRGHLPSGFQAAYGYFATDASVPLHEGTWQSIYWSAQSAIEAANRVREGDGLVYALCRPPGHHAMRQGANGFCYFNNAAIAADILSGHYGKVALLDVDTHGGNGSQDIFYDRGDVFFASLHVDPSDYPPYYLGYDDETGEGKGEGTNLNLVLDPGADTDTILARLDEGLSVIGAFSPGALVISLGFDMAGDDPLSVVDMTGEGFCRMAEKILSLGLPTVLVQEGGYLGPSLAANAELFLTTCRKIAAQ